MQGGDHYVKLMNPVDYDQEDQTFLGKTGAQIATLQVSAKGFFALRLRRFPPLSNQVGHGVLPARVRFRKSRSHTTCNLTRQEERRGTQKRG